LFCVTIPARELWGDCERGWRDKKERRQMDQQGSRDGLRRSWMVHRACRRSRDLGYAAEVWAGSALARRVRFREGGFGHVPRLRWVGVAPMIGDLAVEK
jgi:hypothetical protein